MINLILSTVSIYIHSAGSATVTAYMSFVILILMKLYNAIFISNNSKKNNMALSAYMSELQSYNVLDKDYIENENKKREDWVTENKESKETNNVVVADLNMI